MISSNFRHDVSQIFVNMGDANPSSIELKLRFKDKSTGIERSCTKAYNFNISIQNDIRMIHH